ncbi:hypothetical protein THAOC_19610 [Thalassiosira oceanica]|uniref:Pentacotripeptide-repeat region of PRORP domain-containing protein n=1 Tax=Thalassiosira oceanica TaxID=159749 RepID=K0SGK4_THAOC|nr:hypothetical protein THAOC_19610 [Thalassiosira oceanica]|eukprot:EJK60101.1 hypothetical protein THAOC_19610 [Thalassiosira oceanica]
MIRRIASPSIALARRSGRMLNEDTRARRGVKRVNVGRRRREVTTIAFDGRDVSYFNGGGDLSISTPSTESLIPTDGSITSVAAKNCDTSSSNSQESFMNQIEQWVAMNPKTAPYKAEEALSRLWVAQQEVFSEDPSGDAPILISTESVNRVMKAWEHSGLGIVAAERAERLLRWMEEDLQGARAALLPRADYHSYASVISSWSKAAITESAKPCKSQVVTNSRGRVKQTMISQSTKIGFECAKQSEEMLMKMQREHERRLQEDGAYTDELQPDTALFHHVLRGWSEIKGGTKASATRAIRILDLMQELRHHQSHSESWQGLRFFKILPNLTTYKLAIKAWTSAVHTPEGPDRAEEILRHMLSMSSAGNAADISPDLHCFHMVMSAHAELVRKKRARSDDGVPSVERARKVTALVEWLDLISMRNSKLRPTAETLRIAIAETEDYNTLINACSFARGVGVGVIDEDDIDALVQKQMTHLHLFGMAEQALQSLLSSSTAKADSATFSGILRACTNLVPDTDERDAKVLELFRLAYQTEPCDSAVAKATSPERKQSPAGGGCVDANVLRQLRKSLPTTEAYIKARERFESYRLLRAGSSNESAH